MTGPVRVLILGTGNMARRHVEFLRKNPHAEIVAAVDPEPDRLAAFCAKHAIARSFPSLDAALEWGAFDAASNVTPDSIHYPTTMALIAARKHVFCEKPLAPNHRHAAEMTSAAAQAGVVAMVNLAYRNVPALQKARELALNGELGEIRHVEASYLQSWLTSNHWGDWRTTPSWLWRLSRQHGSNGVLGDIGIHVLDFASYGTGLEITDMDSRLQTFNKAEGGRVGEFVLDANDSFVMSVAFENGALGALHATRMATGVVDDLRMRIFGDRGAVEVSFAHEGSADRVSRLRACLGENRHTQTWEEIPPEAVETTYARFIRAVREGKTLEPSFAHAADLQMLLDQALASEEAREASRTAETSARKVMAASGRR